MRVIKTAFIGKYHSWNHCESDIPWTKSDVKITKIKIVNFTEDIFFFENLKKYFIVVYYELYLVGKAR